MKITEIEKFFTDFKNGGGFTLVEIMSVLAIIGIIATIALPTYRNITPILDLNGATRDVASDLRLAQQKAITEQDIYAVQFDILNNDYSLINDTLGETIFTKDIDSDILIQSITGLTDNKARFNATGAAIETGEIIFLNANNATSSIEIKPSGYVKIIK